MQHLWRGPLAAAGLFILGATSACSLFGSDDSTAVDTGAGGKVEQKVEKEIWTMRDMYVRLEPQDSAKGGGTPLNQHPVNVADSQLYNAFSQITIKTNEKIGYVPLFTDFELDVLSRHIAEGLAQASPNQDVTFAIVGWHKGGGGMFASVGSQQVTTGRVFYQNGRINLIIGEAHRDVSEGEDYATKEAGTGDRRLDPFVPGMRGFTQSHKWVLAAAPSAGVYGAPGGRRSDWLVFSAQALAAAPPAAPGTRSTGPSAAEQARYDQLQQQVNQLQQQLQNMHQGQGAAPAAAAPVQPAYPGYPAQQPGYAAPPAYPGYQAPAYPNQTYPNQAYPNQGYYNYGYPAPAQAAPTAPAAPQAQSPEGTESVQQRLMVLDDLKSKGLISDTEYQQRRNQILSGTPAPANPTN